MKRIIKYLVLISIVISTFISCDNTLPNPIVGSYVLKNSSKHIIAGFCFNEDNTMTYAEIINNTDKILFGTGSYDVTLNSFNFITGSGSINIRVNEFSEENYAENLLLEKGYNPFLFSWRCDRTNGPQSLTLVTDPQDPQKNYELVYVGSPSTFNDIFGTAGV